MTERAEPNLATLLEEDGDLEYNRVETRRLVAFEAGQAVYGIPISDVAEVKGSLPLTPLPIGRVPNYVLGLVSLRGTIVPVVDLSALLGHAATEDFEQKPLIFVKGTGWLVAWLVESIRGLIRLPVDSFHPAPARNDGAEFCEAVTQLNGEILIQLDTQKLLGTSASEVGAQSH